MDTRNINQNLNQETKREEGITFDLPSLVPVIEEKTAFDEKGAKYRKSKSAHIFYMRMYLLFFFFGACVFASGKWGYDGVSQKVSELLFSETWDFSRFCVTLYPFVFGSFFVYASGFTVYAPLLSGVYSIGVFTLGGIVSGSIVYLYGVRMETFISLFLVGMACALCIILCSVSVGISKIASMGIGKVNISDGVLYSLLYWAYVICQYYLIKGISALLCF